MHFLRPNSKKKKANKYLKMFQETWHHNFRVNLQAEVTHGTWVFWPSQSNASIFKQLNLFETISELASENIIGYIYPVSIHQYIQNKFLTYICEVGDPVLSQNLDRRYVVSKAKQGGEMRRNTERCFKKYGIIFFGLMYRFPSISRTAQLPKMCPNYRNPTLTRVEKNKIRKKKGKKKVKKVKKSSEQYAGNTIISQKCIRIITKVLYHKLLHLQSI